MKKLGRPANPANKDKQVTWVRLTKEQRHALKENFGGYQRGLETLVKQYMTRRDGAVSAEIMATIEFE